MLEAFGNYYAISCDWDSCSCAQNGGSKLEEALPRFTDTGWVVSPVTGKTYCPNHKKLFQFRWHLRSTRAKTKHQNLWRRRRLNSKAHTKLLKRRSQNRRESGGFFMGILVSGVIGYIIGSVKGSST